jgi:hypothetical protein
LISPIELFVGEIMFNMRSRFFVWLVPVVISLATVAAIGKIPPLKPVVPVESDGVRYSADENGSDQYVSATDIRTAKQLWRVRVFHTHIKPWLEPDVQLVFITELRLVGGSLFVRDGKARCYAIDVRDHRVHKADCGGFFAQQESSRR